jgi:putative tricarboxylic transport membrane protein
MSWSARVPGVALVALGLAIGIEALGFGVAFLTDPVGPKALPWLAAAALVLAGCRLALRADTATPWPAGAVLTRMGLATGGLLLYGIVLPWLGFLLSTTLVVAALSHLFGAAPRHSLPAAAGLTVALWLLFARALALPLPIGDLWMR